VRLTEAFPLASALSEPVRKQFRKGTHREVPPAKTLTRVRSYAKRMGITRLGNVTGLDHIGIPVAIAVRPNSCSVSVCQGKGLTLDQAFASAMMEAVEQFHGEDIAGRFRLSSYHDLAVRSRVVDPTGLAGNGTPFDPAKEIHWIEGYDLLHRESCWVPAEIVHTDYTLKPRPDSGAFLRGTNGLASGNNVAEALSAAICEAVERDAASLWGAQPLQSRSLRWLDIASVDDADCRWLLDRFAAAGIGVRVWVVTSDIGIPAFVCDIRETSDDPRLGTRRFRGAGCHPDRAIALARALSEAAQTRLTYIVGSRDDLPLSDYDAPANADLSEALLDVLQAAGTPGLFREIPSCTSDDIAEDVVWELDRLRSVGVNRVIAVDLTRPEFGIPVLRVVIPGLEGDCRNAEYVPARRARVMAGVR